MARFPHPHDTHPLIYGCMEINRDAEAGLAQVRRAIDAGITFFDHADIYGAGESERVFSGLWTDKPSLRGELILQSKCGIRFPDAPNPGDPFRHDSSFAHIVESVDGILKRLKTDYLDILLIHRPDPLMEPEEIARAFDELDAAGKVRAFGVSNHSGAQLRLLRKFLRQPIIVNQLQLSLLHCSLIEGGFVVNQDTRQNAVLADETGTIDYCRQHDITIQCWGPLDRGRLAQALDGDESDERIRRCAEVASQLAEQYAVTVESIQLAWLLRHPAGLRPVIGTQSAERLQACCQSVEVRLSREDWYHLFNAARGA